MAWIRWQEDLKSPKAPGLYAVPSGGTVWVTEANIKTAAEAEGRCKFELHDQGRQQGSDKRYSLGHTERLLDGAGQAEGSE